MSSTLILGLESRRSTCLIACLGFRPRAAARPRPIVQTASEALRSTPRVASESEATRLACRSWFSTPPRTWRTWLKENRCSRMTMVSSDLLLLAGRFVGSPAVGSRLGEFATICRCRWCRDSFRNRVYPRPIPLCPAGNEGMSEHPGHSDKANRREFLHKIFCRNGGYNSGKQPENCQNDS